MEDAELEAIRQKRMAELMAQRGIPPQRGAGSTSAEDKEKEEEKEEMRQMMLARILSQEARQRLARISLVKPEKARAVENLIIRNSQYAQLQQKITEAQLITLLEQINEQTQHSTKVTIQRRRSTFDDE